MSQAYARIKEARDYITSKTSISPKIGMHSFKNDLKA